MYFCQNPMLYDFHGQVFFFPQIISPSIVFGNSFEKKEEKFQQLSQQKKVQNFEMEPDSNSHKNQTTGMGSIDSKQQKQEIDSDYQPENNEILIFYKKKNTESNLSNQIYSYISCNKSSSLMLKLFDGNQEKVEEFYKLIKKIKKTNKKYMNRNYIADLIKLQEGSTNFKIYKRSKCSIEIQEIRRALRISFQYFLENVCDLGLMTSKKMNKDTLLEHFARKREIMEYLRDQIMKNGDNNC